MAISAYRNLIASALAVVLKELADIAPRAGGSILDATVIVYRGSKTAENLRQQSTIIRTFNSEYAAPKTGDAITLQNSGELFIVDGIDRRDDQYHFLIVKG